MDYQVSANLSAFPAPNANYTNLEAGLRLAASVEPTDARHHVVLLSDGRQNLGDILSGARLLHSQGIRVDVRAHVVSPSSP